MSAPTDIIKLVRDAQQGDTEAFSALVQCFQQEIYIYISKHLKNCEDAHDLTQQVFLKAWLSLITLKETTCIRLWLYRIARNLTNDYWRKKRIISLSLEALTLKDMLTRIPGPEDKTEKEELIKLALYRLPPKLRLCLLLRIVEGLSSYETARVVGIKEASVGTYVSMARKKFRSIYHFLENENTLEEMFCS